LEEQDRSGLDYIFGWHGNTDLIMAIIKLVEDKMNAEEDIHRRRRAGHPARRGLGYVSTRPTCPSSTS